MTDTPQPPMTKTTVKRCRICAGDLAAHTLYHLKQCDSVRRLHDAPILDHAERQLLIERLKL